MKVQIIRLLFFVALLSHPLRVVAQIDSLRTTPTDTLWKLRRKNSIVLEGLGTGFIGTLGYERILRNRPKNYLALRGGIFVYKEGQKNLGPSWEADYLLTVSITKNKFRRRNRYVEYGGAITWGHEIQQYTYWHNINNYPNEYELRTRAHNTIALFGIIGYRWQKINAPIFFKASFNPVLLYQFGDYVGKGFICIPWAGFMVGYSFKYKSNKQLF